MTIKLVLKFLSNYF